MKQIADTKDLMVKGIDVLLSSPGTPAANPGQEAAFQKGIPVVQFDRTGGTEQFTAILLTDEIQIGTEDHQVAGRRHRGQGQHRRSEWCCRVRGRVKAASSA